MPFVTKKQNLNICIEGLILPCDWDEDGRPIEYKLCTYNEDEYFLDIRNQKLVSKYAKIRVLVTGKLQNKGGLLVLKVSRIEKAKRVVGGS